MPYEKVQIFTVVTTYIVNARNHFEAAQKAHVLADEKSPHAFVVTTEAGIKKNIILSHEERDIAIARHAEGDWFEDE